MMRVWCQVNASRRYYQCKQTDGNGDAN